jgi:ABC-type dipeptide/oligopeptide/nickel transport system permease subunit
MVKTYRELGKNKLAMIGLGFILLVAFCAVFAPILAPYGPTKASLSLRLSGPTPQHIFGTDQLGRDVLSRVIYGARTSLRSSAVVILFSSTVGILLGVIAGYWGGVLGLVIMRFVDFLLAFPSFLLAMTIVAILGPSLDNAVIAVAISYIGPLARLVRGTTIKAKENEFVEAAWAVGASGLHTIFQHIIPNILSSIIVQVTLNFGAAIIDIAGLSFIGLGAQPPTAEWGAMLSGGRYYIQIAWWLPTFPGIAIMTTVLGCVFIGDGLREIMDPKYVRSK